MLAELRNRALRERLYRASVSRGVGGKDDTTAIVVRLVKLRSERARLWATPTTLQRPDDETAGTPARADAMMRNSRRRRAPGRTARRPRSRSSWTARRRPGMPVRCFNPGTGFYQSRCAAHYDFDEARSGPISSSTGCCSDGVFYAAHELYGLIFSRTHRPAGVRAGYRVFESDEGEKRSACKSPILARDNKQAARDGQLR